uniref:hypothetical protein n=1 Tax=Salmonella sp. s54925 TaxID=3159674 RepID=UPI00397F114B
EIQRFERIVERERQENESLLMKGKSRKAEIELLQYRLLNEFGVEPLKKDKPGKIKDKKKKEIKRKVYKEDGQEIDEKLSALKSGEKRGFTSIVKN